MRARAVRAAAAALAALPLALLAAPAVEESVRRVPVGAAGARAAPIEVTVMRPAAPGRFPVLVLSHGSPRSADERRRAGRVRYEAQSRAFVAMGFAVVLPTRRGYGDSGGEWSEGYGSCANPDYVAAGLETARDIRAALEAVRREPWADASRVVLAGQSAGGWGSIAAAADPPRGLVGVVNFAGGRGSASPGIVCREDRLVEAAARFARSGGVPQLWIYSENDHYFGPELARRMHAAFVAAGGRAEFVQAPPAGADGHGYFTRAVRDWAPRVEEFLRLAGAIAGP